MHLIWLVRFTLCVCVCVFAQDPSLPWGKSEGDGNTHWSLTNGVKCHAQPNTPAGERERERERDLRQRWREWQANEGKEWQTKKTCWISHTWQLSEHSASRIKEQSSGHREKRRPEQKWGTRWRKETERRELWVRVELLWFIPASSLFLSTSSWCFLVALDQAFFWCLCEKFDAHSEKLNSCMHYAH